MKSLPFWKLQRELRRAFGQLFAAPLASARYVLATPYHDLVLARRRRISQGEVALGGRAAVYLMFPRRGVSASHLRSLGYLRSGGHAPIVVSNQPLTEDDRARLRPLAAVIIERENFGYDFGGYRDAILWLGAGLAGLDRLVLLNDSTWFPLPGASDWLAEAEALGVDYAAATWTGAVQRPAPWNYEQIEWKVDKSRRNFHYASYALAFSHRILADADFLRFWRKFRLAQEKNRTVRRGEIGLTAWMVRRGYSHGATVELADLPERLAALPVDELRRMFARLIVHDDAEMAAIGARIPPDWSASPDGRRMVEKFIQAVTARRGAGYALADYLIGTLRFPFLKKSPAKSGGTAARIAEALIRELEPPLRDEILAEIGALEQPVTF